VADENGAFLGEERQGHRALQFHASHRDILGGVPETVGTGDQHHPEFGLKAPLAPSVLPGEGFSLFQSRRGCRWSRGCTHWRLEIGRKEGGLGFHDPTPERAQDPAQALKGVSVMNDNGLLWIVFIDEGPLRF